LKIITGDIETGSSINSIDTGSPLEGKEKRAGRRISGSWIFLLFFITWSFAQGILPFLYPDLSSIQLWLLGIAGSFGIICSVLLHESGHLLAEKFITLPPAPVTFFLFGGIRVHPVSGIGTREHIIWALAGPAANILGFLVLHTAGIFYSLYDMSSPVQTIIDRIAWVNLLIAGLNMLPLYPLDGGLIFKTLLWYIKKNYEWSLNVSINTSYLIVGCTFTAGILVISRGRFMEGIWWIVAGILLRDAIAIVNKKRILRDHLEGDTIEGYYRNDPVTVPSSATLDEFIKNYALRYRFDSFPVIVSGILKCISLENVRAVPFKNRSFTYVNDAAVRVDENNSVSFDTDCMIALEKMYRAGTTQLAVTDNETGTLQGVITFADLLPFLSRNIELEMNG